MAKRVLHRLSARTLDRIEAKGRHADGGGLYLFVSEGRRRWVFRYTRNGRIVEMGLGSAAKGQVSLSMARQLASEARSRIIAGADPLEERRRTTLAAANRPTFGEFADALIEDLSLGFRNTKHSAQWRMTLTRYAAPIRGKCVDEVTTDDIVGVLEPLWLAKSETASRLRGRIERVLDAAKARGLRSGENPARWRGHLDSLLPKQSKLVRGHHPAMPYREVPAFFAELRGRDGIGAIALRFLVLTAGRTSEILQAQWQEIDIGQRLWVVPATRMKAGREHRIPLSVQAIELLMGLPNAGEGRFVFATRMPNRPPSAMTLAMVMRRAEKPYTVHGFRSSFRDWVSEETGFSSEVAETALAHIVGDSTERAYRRGDTLAKRRQLMEAWAEFVGQRQQVFSAH